MNKKSRSSLNIIVPDLELCPRCRGYGTEKPMLHEMVCGGCGGAGFVDQATGAALDPGISLVALNRALRRHRLIIADLRRELSKHPAEPDRYGELKTVMGGKYRGD